MKSHTREVYSPGACDLTHEVSIMKSRRLSITLFPVMLSIGRIAGMLFVTLRMIPPKNSSVLRFSCDHRVNVVRAEASGRPQSAVCYPQALTAWLLVG